MAGKRGPYTKGGLYQRGDSWILDFVHKGERHVVTIGKANILKRWDAKRIATVKRARILLGEAGIGKKQKDCELGDAVTAFLKWAQANTRPNTVELWQYCFANLEKSLGAQTRLSKITPVMIEAHKQSRIKAGVKVMVNRELDALRRLYNVCAGPLELYQGDNPARGKRAGGVIERVRESAGKVRFLTPEEEAAWSACLEEPYKTLLLLGIHAGTRLKAEGLTLE
jgi:hypothetical protein